MKLKLSVLSLALAGSLLGGCNDDDGIPAKLSILHINDHHSHLTEESADLMLAGAETRVQTGGFARIVSKMNELEANAANGVLKLHAGDAITGDLYYTLFKGEADAVMMNQVCFDAFALGNHEFDDGDAELKKFLDYLKGDGSCGTSVLAANVVPEVGVSPLAMNSATDYIRPYVIKEFDGQQYGIIGIDIANKTKNSSNPDVSTQFLDETTTAQKYIDELQMQGVNKIILMTHYQYENDRVLAQNLSGVDVIVGGDSHTLLGDKFNDLGLSAAGSYPTKQANLDGDQVCIVQAWQYSSVVGELNVSFDADGKVESCSGTPHLLLADSFQRRNVDGDRVELEGTERAAVIADVEATAELSVVTPDAATESLLAGYTDQVDQLSAAKIGTAADDLCLVRIPGESRSTICDPEETASNGSDISNIVAKAFLEMSNTSDICIQNGGGVRVDVPAGDISIGTAYTLLPFGNTLLELDMTGQQIIDVLEEAIVYALDPDGSTGAYPYAAGLRWDLDLSKPAGQRFSNVQINPRVAGSWQAIDTAATYKVVTNSFTGGGQDGYLTFGEIADDKRVDTFLDYAQSFVDYVKRETAAGRAIVKLPLAEYSTQKFTNQDGVLQ
ncbi:MAG: NAD nucleotidase [Thiolinea sp.]